MIFHIIKSNILCYSYNIAHSFPGNMLIHHISPPKSLLHNFMANDMSCHLGHNMLLGNCRNSLHLTSSRFYV